MPSRGPSIVNRALVNSFTCMCIYMYNMYIHIYRQICTEPGRKQTHHLTQMKMIVCGVLTLGKELSQNQARPNH